ncbi:MAG: N-acetylmuramoyl-L-alanine amidase [Candidatus Poribacteria bacterium]|nr:N-acetylmuramoyl-L-alanine amidase [Candidatus Poribacteria bacterium]
MKKPLNSLRNQKLSPVGAGTTTKTNNAKAQGKYVNRYAVPLKAGVLSLGILVFAATLSSIAQQPSVRFIDADGKTIAEVPAQHRETQVYLPVDALKQVIDPATTHQYNHPRKRLTLKIKGREIRLQMDKPTVSIDAGGQTQTLTLSTPPIIIAQRPMLPIAFFKQLLPILNDVDVIYNSNLNRLQIRPKSTWTSVETDNIQNWSIIVDPGHGGDDQGCEGSTGILEKNIVLALAKQLQRISKQQGVQVHLTRETDTKKTQFERIQIAKQNRGQLFLSLHCNASFSPHEKGIRIYLNNPKGQIRFPSTTKPALTGQRLKVLTQVNFLKQSHDFARALQTELNFLTETPVQIINLPLIALSEAYMPAVVLELGYLSNVEDLDKLSNAEYTESVSQAITRALQRYISSVNQQTSATPIE